jgi:hypothetical protein
MIAMSPLKTPASPAIFTPLKNMSTMQDSTQVTTPKNEAGGASAKISEFAALSSTPSKNDNAAMAPHALTLSNSSITPIKSATAAPEPVRENEHDCQTPYNEEDTVMFFGTPTARELALAARIDAQLANGTPYMPMRARYGKYLG